MNPLILVIPHVLWAVVATLEILGENRIGYAVAGVPGEFSGGGFLSLILGTLAVWLFIGINTSVELMVIFLAADVFFLVLSFIVAHSWLDISVLPVAKGFFLGLMILLLCLAVFYILSLI
jgi:hypothetical protein